MIRYPITVMELEARIEDRIPGWLRRAHARTESLRAAGRYNEVSAIWSEIKPVYMEIQFNKCAYCERRLEGPDAGTTAGSSVTGRIEHDVEHFRPKGAIDAWPDESHPSYAGLSYPYPTGAASAAGYYFLAYSLSNYAVACKTCNSELKGTYFPVAESRALSTDDPESLHAEMPYLIYPIGNIDDDPIRLIGFEGILPVPIGTSAHNRRRGQITIDLFLLHKRDTLRDERIEVIGHLFFALLIRDDTAKSEKHLTLAAASVVALTASSARHCSCARSFVQLWESDRAKAEGFATEALAARGIISAR